jgi:hypothetical protein
MSTVAAEVVLGIFEVVNLAAFFAFGPKIRAPEKQR